MQQRFGWQLDLGHDVDVNRKAVAFCGNATEEQQREHLKAQHHSVRAREMQAVRPTTGSLGTWELRVWDLLCAVRRGGGLCLVFKKRDMRCVRGVDG